MDRSRFLRVQRTIGADGRFYPLLDPCGETRRKYIQIHGIKYRFSQYNIFILETRFQIGSEEVNQPTVSLLRRVLAFKIQKLVLPKIITKIQQNLKILIEKKLKYSQILRQNRMYFHINLLKNNVVYYYNSYKRKSRNNKDEGIKNWNWY